jgi:hypothetical protein
MSKFFWKFFSSGKTRIYYLNTVTWRVVIFFVANYAYLVLTQDQPDVARWCLSGATQM